MEGWDPRLYPALLRKLVSPVVRGTKASPWELGGAVPPLDTCSSSTYSGMGRQLRDKSDAAGVLGTEWEARLRAGGASTAVD